MLTDGTDLAGEALPPGSPEIADGPAIRFTRGSFATTVRFPAGAAG